MSDLQPDPAAHEEATDESPPSIGERVALAVLERQGTGAIGRWLDHQSEGTRAWVFGVVFVLFAVAVVIAYWTGSTS